MRAEAQAIKLRLLLHVAQPLHLHPAEVRGDVDYTASMTEHCGALWLVGLKSSLRP